VTLAQYEHRKVVLVILTTVDKLEVETLGHHGGDHSQRGLCESLSKADALPPIEWHPTKHWPLLAFRSQRVRVLRVKAIRVEPLRLFPVF